ncbi:MAG: ASCH domain-containing protein [Symploca sp. SIO2D2]|nr:ASCH domain-containing protein [Symploca sp. SIO2D2]
MRCITLHQPYATLIALGLKHYETRSWATNYRGALLIHAAKKNAATNQIQAINLFLGEQGLPKELNEFVKTAHELPVGCVVAIVDLSKCLKMADGWGADPDPPLLETIIQTKSYLERSVGYWKPGRYAWRLEDIHALPKPIPCKGKQGLWIPSDELIQSCQAGC